MGQHTWLWKDKSVYMRVKDLYDKLDDSDSGKPYIDDMEEYQINSEISKLEKENSVSMSGNNLFRTSKRDYDSDGGSQYTEDRIFSLKQCRKWLIDNKEFVYDLDMDRVEKFWEEYPDGVIDFG